MSFDFTRDIETMISSAYGRALISVNSHVLPQQIVITNVENDGIDCNECLSVFMEPNLYDQCIIDPTKPDTIINREPCGNNGLCPTTREDCTPTEKDTFKLMDRLTGFDREKREVVNTDAICYNRCVTNIESLDVESSLIFKSVDSVTPTNPNDLKIMYDSIAKSVTDQLKKKYPKAYEETQDEATKKAVMKILYNVDIKQVFNTSQVANLIQVIEIKGAGTFKNINMKIVADLIFNAVHNANIEIRSLDDISTEMISKVKNDVDKAIMSQFKYVWKMIKGYLIKSAIIFGIVILAIIVMLFIRAAK